MVYLIPAKVLSRSLILRNLLFHMCQPLPDFEKSKQEIETWKKNVGWIK